MSGTPKFGSWEGGAILAHLEFVRTVYLAGMLEGTVVHKESGPLDLGRKAPL
jgi:hypothetical protein